jgi:predicted NAD/FAD-binding protein
VNAGSTARGDRLRVAVIGSGVSGLTAAHLIARRHQVVLYEREPRLGGHAHTVLVAGADGRRLGLDTGFIVHNERTYPTLLRLFRELRVETQDSDMSFGVHCEGCGLEYAGARGLAGIVPRVSTLARPRYLRMLTEVRRFHRHARRVLADPARERLTFGAMLSEGGYSHYFCQHFALPLTGAIWSSSHGGMLEFPARYLIRFFANHGMLTVTGSPQWKTVTGGSRAYVSRIADQLGDGVLVGVGAVEIARTDRGVVVADTGGHEERFDRIVIATHPDQALRILADADERERDVLSRFAYTSNQTVLHTDPSLLPSARGARASWNSRMDMCSHTTAPVQITYHLNRLQALREPVDYCVTLNQAARVRAGARLAEMVYDHPVYTLDTPQAQRELPGLNGRRGTVFCGAYHGWGFHEDGCASGLRAASALGCGW